LSFRRRLTLFFLLIVVLPMVGLGVLVTQLSRESSTGKADARLAASMESALSVYDGELGKARRAAHQAARDARLVEALRERRAGEVRDAVRSLVPRLDLAAIAVIGPGGQALADTGSNEPVAEAEVDLRSPRGTLGSVSVAGTTADSFADEVREITRRQVAIVSDGEPIASTVDLTGVALSASTETDTVELSGEESRLASVPLRGAGPDARLALFSPLESGGLTSARPLVAAALVAFFAIALLFIIVLVRSLQGQIAEMLAAAKRIGGGDFSREVPIQGDDEVAGLASEFNKMSDRLAEQMAELRRQRAELERSIRRIGEAFAHGLDRDALLDIVAETALAACEAETSRIVLAGRTRAEAEAGVVADGPVAETLQRAEAAALQEGGEAEVRSGEVQVLAGALTGIHDSKRRLGVMSIARHGGAFESGHRELFRYLVGQASISVENVDLHELVAEQAITDELTGLSNQRRFRRLIEKEASRAERFGHKLSVMILDIDDFKQVNDTYGHLQGDEVLKAIGAILLDESRGVDEPARYGGEEFVLALPETGMEGALEVAERVRRRVEQARVPRIDGVGALRVTASVGVATMPEAARDVRALIAVADEALYRAKGAGKNRCEQAEPAREPAWSVTAQGQAPERRS
jgi:diguanylate cyclase (GGDEF)-like protein